MAKKKVFERPEGAKIRAIVKRPDEKYGHVTNISSTLENFQKTVDGFIEVVPFNQDVLIVNEEGKYREDLEPNFWFNGDLIIGTVALVGVDGMNFTDAVTKYKDWKDWLDKYGRPER